MDVIFVVAMHPDQIPKIYLYRRVVRAKLFIDNHFALDLNLGDMAEEALFSKFHFIRLFKHIYRKTPHQYLMSVRIEKAKQLLQTGMTVHETCFSVGFESLGSFSALFKKLTGLSPSRYQQQQMERQAALADMPLRFVPNCFARANGWA